MKRHCMHLVNSMHIEIMDLHNYYCPLADVYLVW